MWRAGRQVGNHRSNANPVTSSVAENDPPHHIPAKQQQGSMDPMIIQPPSTNMQDFFMIIIGKRRNTYALTSFQNDLHPLLQAQHNVQLGLQIQHQKSVNASNLLLYTVGPGAKALPTFSCVRAAHTPPERPNAPHRIIPGAQLAGSPPRFTKLVGTDPVPIQTGTKPIQI